MPVEREREKSKMLIVRGEEREGEKERNCAVCGSFKCVCVCAYYREKSK